MSDPTRLAFVADVHAANHKRFGFALTSGVNARCRAVVAALAHARGQAESDGADAFIVLGDLFDNVKPEPQVIAAVADAFTFTNVRCRVHLLMGNHDQASTERDDSALAPLARIPNVIVHERPEVVAIGGVDVWFAPYHPGEGVKWLKHAIMACSLVGPGGTKRRPRVLATHLGIRDEDTPPWLRESRDAVDLHEQLAPLMREYEIDACFAGNWHEHRSWRLRDDRMVIQVGALAPTGFDNPGLTGYGRMPYFIATEREWRTVTTLEIPGPRFVTVDSLERLNHELASNVYAKNELFVRWLVATSDALGPATDKIVELMRARRISAGMAEVDTKVMASEARSAATAARSADTLAERLAAFVKALPMPEGVTADDVLARARGYLARGA